MATDEPRRCSSGCPTTGWKNTVAPCGSRANRRRYCPRPVRLRPDGIEGDQGSIAISSRRRSASACAAGFRYGVRQTSDFGKLATLGPEGRSTATTILSLAAIRDLRDDARCTHAARKLLSFTDNRQDASLQAGHFNDFVEIGLLRSALYQGSARGRARTGYARRAGAARLRGAGSAVRALRQRSGRAVPGAQRRPSGAPRLCSATGSTAT